MNDTQSAKQVRSKLKSNKLNSHLQTLQINYHWCPLNVKCPCATGFTQLRSLETVERPADKDWQFLLNLGRNFFSATPEVLRHD